mmetsp:Transcript_7941/g.28975  ORF Transcript_7941/g.28975 Transcript_7941/m.28975 type:complete len:87 (-) Transcript_7941:132-392(-)
MSDLVARRTRTVRTPPRSGTLLQQWRCRLAVGTRRKGFNAGFDTNVLHIGMVGMLNAGVKYRLCVDLDGSSTGYMFADIGLDIELV